MSLTGTCSRSSKTMTLKKKCVCYSCTEHMNAAPVDDQWVNQIRDMIRDGRLEHIDTDADGKNVYRAT